MIELGKLIHNRILVEQRVPEGDRNKLFRIISYKKITEPCLKIYSSEDILNDLNGLPIVLSTVDNCFKIFEHEVKQVFD